MQIKVTTGVSQTPRSSALSRQQELADFRATLAAASESLVPGAASIAVTGSTPSGERDSAARVESGVAATGKSAADQLVEFLNKSVAERVRDAVLKSMGLSEEDLAALPPEQRAAVEKGIAERVAQALSGLTDPQAQSRQAASADGSALSLSALLR